MKYDVLIVGAGLAGLSCGYELAAKGKKVLILEAHDHVGGRTSSFTDDGMAVESGLHRYIGYYSALPDLMKKCGVEINDMVTWEEKADILVKGEHRKIVLGLAPLWGFSKTIRGIVGNEDILSWRDKFSLVPFFLKGFGSSLFSDNLDRFSVADYANKTGVSPKAQRLLLEPLSTGIFFLPPEQYSSYVFFRLFAPAIPKFYKMRIGAYLGGMTEVMCEPIVGKITELGGEVRKSTKIISILLSEDKVIGLRSEKGEEFFADHTVIAASLPEAKRILEPLKHRNELQNLFALPTMSACTFQMELDKPALEKDITSFGPGTDMVSFAEQSRSTFQQSHGRLSVILGHPERYIHLPAEEIRPIVEQQMESLGISLSGKILRCRKVAEPQAFYSLSPGSQKLRPHQHTDIPGLTLAGDYTLTSSFATMEGAVLSGIKAADDVLNTGRIV